MVLFALETHIWGRAYDRLVPVQSWHCRDCGRLIFRPTALGQSIFYLLDESVGEEFIQTKIQHDTWEEKFLLASVVLDRLGVKPVEAELAYEGFNENNEEGHYCIKCGNTWVNSPCRLCGVMFKRTKVLPQATLCLDCLKKI